MTSPRSLLTLALLASLSLPACAATPKERIVPIGDVQGDGARSPLDGQTVTVEGVVTAAFAHLGGVFVQDAGDGKATTSDALFVAFPGDQSEDLPAMVSADQIDPAQMLMLEDGHCLKDHALAACSRPELRADPAHRGTSLVTLVEMVAGGLGQTLLPKLALDADILTHGLLKPSTRTHST